MKRRIAPLFLGMLALVLSMSSCFKDLDLEPPYGLNANVVYSDPANYINVLAKIYAGLATTGNNGPAGSGDIAGIDEGFSNYLRVLWNLQVLTTDEAVCAWEQDPGIPELNRVTITSLNEWNQAMYYRIYFQLGLCNEFIRQASDAALADRGFSDAEVASIREMRHEVRFLRALSYFHALDLYGNVPFITEDDEPGAFFPQQIFRDDLFAYVESELLEVEALMKEPGTHEYARADRAAAWMTLAKLYLNAEVYVGQNRYTEAAEWAKRVIDAGVFSLEPEYEHLFLTDNGDSREIIFRVAYDGLRTKTYGGTTYLVHASIGGTMDPDSFGVNVGWGGLRSTPEFVDQFTDSVSDGRYLFEKEGQTRTISDIAQFTEGYAVTKWRNVDRNGVAGVDPTGDFVDTDFPLYRLADAYLIYAEAALRGGGDVGLGLNYVNQLRERAYGNSSGNVASIDLDFILAERCRELYWECHRRTDLIRFGRFTGSDYLWSFKGGAPEGAGIAEHLNLYPIPAADIIANPNLTQNDGY
jgi:hypothetical protein